jgi:HK97 family phage major capsid protein
MHSAIPSGVALLFGGFAAGGTAEQPPRTLLRLEKEIPMPEKIFELRQQRLDIVDKMATLNGGDMTPEQEAQYAAHETELNKVKAAIEREENLLVEKAELAKTDGRLTAPTAQAHVKEKKFDSLGDFMAAVCYTPQILAELRMDVGQQGGFLVPPEFSAELLKFDPESVLIRPGARVIPAGPSPDASVTFPALNQGALGVHGGVTVAWLAEGGAKPETEPRLHQVTLNPREVAGHIDVTDTLLRNSGAGSLIAQMLRDAIFEAEDAAFISGNGIAQPQGILGAPGTITVNRAGAGAIATADTLNLVQALHPSSVGTAMWICSQSAMTQIAQLADANNNAVFYQGNATQGLASTLWGIPIKFTGKVPTLGNQGDLMLVDRRHYLIKDGVGPLVASSEHVNFLNNRTVIKIFKTVDGQPWNRAPLTLEDGATQVSPFVVLN